LIITAWDIGNSVQDAFVIAVEEHARERLQRLAALNRVTPVDITQLSKKIACNSATLTTASTATSGLISATTITPTVAAALTTNVSKTKTITVAATAGAVGIGGSLAISAVASDNNANNSNIAREPAVTKAITQTTTTTATTSLIANHKSVYQTTQLLAGQTAIAATVPATATQHKLKLASSLQHLALAEEDDDDDLAAVGANYCSINFINYKNKHAEIPTPTTAAVAATILTATSDNAATVNTFSATATVHQQQPKHHFREHIPPPLQIPSHNVQQQQQQQQQQQHLYDNKQLNYSPNSSISKGRTELLLGDQTLRQEISFIQTQ
ncbi:hypothetical protein GQX74_008045, partial [Glossina fuscipes]